MNTAHQIKNSDINSWRQLASAFYCLAHNDFELWNELSNELKQTDVGLICEDYIKTKIQF